MKSFTHTAHAAAMAALLCLTAAPAFAAPGDLDATFGTGGKVTTPIGSSIDGALSVAFQSDGKIVVAGFSYSGGTPDFALARYNADGSLDTSFGGTGKISTAIGSSDDFGTSVAVQGDGKILVAGYSYNGSNGDFALVRYTDTGALDASFGSGGKVITPIGAAEDNGRAVVVQSDGKIVVAGNSYNGSNDDIALARYTSTGALDASFGTGGILTTPIGSGNDRANAVVVQSDGKIVVAGDSSGSFAAVRYTETGMLDTSFGSAGKVTTLISGGGEGLSVVVQSDGKIIVAGYASIGGNYDFALVRYTDTGTLDTSFGSSGTVSTPFSVGGHDVGKSIAVQSDGKLVVAGYTNGSTYDFALVRYTSTGALDAGFGNGGKVVTPIGSGFDAGHSVAIQADGMIVVAGETGIGSSNNDFALVRYEGDPVDSTTEAPALISPATNAVTGSPVAVDFTLPEAALPGSVKLSFGAAELQLAASQETSGAHSFTFNPANPAASAEIASGSSIADGTYTVTLSYQDALGNPPASAVATNVMIDTAAPTGGMVAIATSPVISGQPWTVDIGGWTDAQPTVYFIFSVLGHFTSDFYSAAAPMAPVNVDVSYWGAPLAPGSYTLRTIIYDDAGNTTTVDLPLTVISGAPARTILAAKGGAVPGAGVNPLIAAGALWTSFGVPSINDAGDVAFIGSWKAGATVGKGIFLNDTLLAKVGAPASWLGGASAGALYSGLKDPVLAPNGRVAWIGTLKNAPGQTAITTANNQGIWIDPDGAGANVPRLWVRKDDELSVGNASLIGTRIKSFTSLAIGQDGMAFTAFFVQGLGGVTAANDFGLWVQQADSFVSNPTAPPGLTIRENDPVLSNIQVKSFTALVGRTGSPGQGQGTVPGNYALSRGKFPDGRQALWRNGQGVVGGPVIGPADYQSGYGATPYATGAVWLSFGQPTQNSAGAMAFVGTVKSGVGGASSANNVAIFAEDDTAYEAARLVTKGDATPGVAGGKFAAFQDPVSGLNRSIAFRGTLTNNASLGIGVGNYHGIWWSDDGGPLNLVARKGYPAAEALPAATIPPGVDPLPVWNTFTSLALPEGSTGPLFVSALRNSTPVPAGSPKLPGPGGVTTANDVGLWAVDSTGALRLLLREGDTIGASTVKNFTVLTSVLGSPAQRRSFNNDGQVLVRVTDAANAQHLVRIDVP